MLNDCLKQPVDQILPTAYFCKYSVIGLKLCLFMKCIVCGCFHTVRAELNSWARHHMAYKPKNSIQPFTENFGHSWLKGTTWEQSFFIRNKFCVYQIFCGSSQISLKLLGFGEKIYYVTRPPSMCVCLKMCTLSDYKFGYIQRLKYSDTQPEGFHGDSESSYLLHK